VYHVQHVDGPNAVNFDFSLHFLYLLMVKTLFIMLAKNFRNEISWDGILAIVAILGIITASIFYCAETNFTARSAVEKTQALEIRQDETDQHLAKIDNAITMIATVLQERTGKLPPSTMIDPPSKKANSTEAIDPP